MLKARNLRLGAGGVFTVRCPQSCAGVIPLPFLALQAPPDAGTAPARLPTPPAPAGAARRTLPEGPPTVRRRLVVTPGAKKVPGGPSGVG